MPCLLTLWWWLAVSACGSEPCKAPTLPVDGTYEFVSEEGGEVVSAILAVEGDSYMVQYRLEDGSTREIGYVLSSE